MLSHFLIYLYLHHIFTIHFYLSFFDTCYLSHLKKIVEGTCLVVAYTIQATSSSMRLMKLLSTI